MRLLLTPILYLGLLCPASVFVTPIRATPIPTVDSTGDVTRALHARDAKAVTLEYTVELRLRQFYVTEPHIITEQIADNLHNGAEILLPWILPVLDASGETEYKLDPETSHT
ncbi:hypothetical protein F5880DRAFT_1608384 [Lentinula raphanica]|nr:hypothetical protein F5880DRAFT_1608384 [Lentinula raphanica]